MRLATFALGMLVLMLPAVGGAQEAAANVPVTEADGLAWERYQLRHELAAVQVETLRLRLEAMLAKELGALNDRFVQHYQLRVDQIERDGDRWRKKP